MLRLSPVTQHKVTLSRVIMGIRLHYCKKKEKEKNDKEWTRRSNSRNYLFFWCCFLFLTEPLYLILYWTWKYTESPPSCSTHIHFVPCFHESKHLCGCLIVLISSNILFETRVNILITYHSQSHNQKVHLEKGKGAIEVMKRLFSLANYLLEINS